MPFRFPLLLKKRGRRRTGSPRWAQAGEILYQSMFVLAGVIGCWWLLSGVLIPESRLAQEAKRFKKTDCRVSDMRVVNRPGLAEHQFCAELRVEFETEAGDAISVWTRHGVGVDVPSSQEAVAALDRYEIDQELPCWYDPQAPQRVLLSRGRRWWPWLVLSIPVSLVIAGTLGVTRALLSSRSSPERRAALRRRVSGTPQAEGESNHPSPSSGLPAADRINDSPGVRLAHRLPMDGAEGWRVLGMAAICVLWNTLAALFVYHLASSALSIGGRVGIALLSIAPLVTTGVWLTYSLWRDAKSVGGAGSTRLELDHHPLKPGELCRGVLMQSGQMRARALTVSLVCEEEATFRQGTDTRTATAEVYRELLHRERLIEVRPGEPFECDFEFVLPNDAPASFVSPHNQVKWSLEVAVGPPRRPETLRRYQVCVYPTSWTTKKVTYSPRSPSEQPASA